MLKAILLDLDGTIADTENSRALFLKKHLNMDLEMTDLVNQSTRSVIARFVKDKREVDRITDLMFETSPDGSQCYQVGWEIVIQATLSMIWQFF